MPRRVIYDPAQFIEASTPFFENVVGTITDQADRISRNLARSREQRAIAEERAFQVGLLQQRQGFQAQMQEDAQQFQGEMQEDSQSFQSEQNRIQMKMQDMQHLDMMDYRYAGLKQDQWMQFMQMQQKLSKDQLNQYKDLEKQANKMLDNIRSSGLTSSRMPNYFHVIPHEETGEPIVGGDGIGAIRWEDFNNPNSRISFLSRLSDFMGTNISNFRRKLADPEDGFAIREVRKDIGDQEGNVIEQGEKVFQAHEDVLLDSEGNIGLGAGVFWEHVNKVKDGLAGWQESAELLERAMGNDRSVQFLYSDNPVAKRWDQSNVSTIFGEVRKAVQKGRSHTGALLNTKGLRNVDEQVFEELYPSLVEMSSPTDPGVTLPAKTIGEAQQAVINQFIAFQDPDEYNAKSNPIFEDQWPAISKFRDFMVSAVEEYGDEMNIPKELRGKSAGFIVDVAYVNPEEFMKDNPDLTKALRWEQGQEKLEVLSEMNEFNLYDDVDAFMQMQDKREAERQARLRIERLTRTIMY